MPHPSLQTIIQIASAKRGLDPDEVTRRYTKPRRGSPIWEARCEATALALGAGYTRADIARALQVEWTAANDYAKAGAGRWGVSVDCQ